MDSLFGQLTDAVSANPGIAALAALAWGVLSVILSPCHLASIPLIIGFIGEQGRTATRRASVLALLFSAGILVTIGSIGAVTGAAGRILGDLGANVTYVVAAIFFVIGLHFLGAIPLPFTAAGKRAPARRGSLAAFLLGIIFGVALGPCTFAFMAPMLGVTLSVGTTNMPYAILLLGMFGVGHTVVIVAAGTFTEMVQKYLRWSSDSRGVMILRRACGVVVILGGIYLMWRMRI